MWRLRKVASILLVLPVALFGATLLSSYESISTIDEEAIWNGPPDYASSQPWWLALPSILTWCALAVWLLLAIAPTRND